MPKPAATHPTSRIAAPPNRTPATSTRTSVTRASQTTDQPMARTATARAAPSAIAISAPTPQLFLRSLEVWLTDDEPRLGSPYGRAGARVVGGNRERQAGPHGIEVKEEDDRDAEVSSQQGAAGRPEIGGYVGEHERERQDHENQAAEHVVHEQHPADVRPRQVLGDEPEQDHGGGEAPVPDDEVRQRGDAGEARPPDPRIAQVLDPRDERLPGPLVDAEAVVLRVIEHRPGQKRPRPPWRTVRMRGCQRRVIDVRLSLVFDEVRQVVELAAREERVPRGSIDGDRDEHQRDQSQRQIEVPPHTAGDGRPLPSSPRPDWVARRPKVNVDVAPDGPHHEKEDD